MHPAQAAGRQNSVARGMLATARIWRAVGNHRSILLDALLLQSARGTLSRRSLSLGLAAPDPIPEVRGGQPPPLVLQDGAACLAQHAPNGPGSCPPRGNPTIQPQAFECQRCLGMRYYLMTDDMLQDSNCQMTIIMHHLDAVVSILAERSIDVVDSQRMFA